MGDHSAEDKVYCWPLCKEFGSPETRLLLRRHLDHLRLTLQPLLSITTGSAHPDFPRTLLHYHVLTEKQLDSLAQFYHQKTLSNLSFNYPEPIVTRWDTKATIEEKRRRFGRFVGLRGCESPENDSDGFDELVMERWFKEKVRQVAEHDWLMNSWKAKGC